MNYLNPLRLHFAGRFQASPSTVNNDPLHYDAAHFIPAYQERGTPGHPNGSWNPGGDGAWRLLGCRVTAAWRPDGSAAGAEDPILGCLVADSDRKVAAKIVDLDPEHQLVSQIWGLEVRVCAADGETLLRGRFESAAFMDIWDRSSGGGGDSGAGAMYQSVLSGLEWGNVGRSPLLTELRERARAGLLSIKFNVDGYNLDFRSPEFTRGRLVGTIGPAGADEPRHFVRGRHFMTTGLPSGNFFAPAGKINFCAAVVNREAGKVYLDLGNALPTVRPGGDPVNLGALSLACSVPSPAGLSAISLGDVPYTEAGWYERTAGVAELPAGRRLTDQELDAILQNSLVLQLPDAGGQPTPAIAEPPGGLYARADQFVFRLEPGDVVEVLVFAIRFGLPYAGARVVSILDPSGLQPQSLLGPAPPVATPAGAIDFPARVVTDSKGVALLPVRADDPGTPRGYIDGQIYGIRPALEETLVPAAGYPFNPWHFVSFLVFSSFAPEEPLTWYGSIRPILEQYGNLYPVMKQILDLTNYDSVCADRRLLLLSLGLDPADPNSMPVTRDLSPAKRRAMLRWLADNPPLRGEARATSPPW